jgi:hypothetical protein
MATMNRTDRANTSQGEFNSTRTVTSDGELLKNPILAPAKVGALTTRTNNTTGELTMDAGHGITTGQRLDLYWLNTDGTRGYRYGITVGTVATNAVPISSGAGDNLPADETAITAMVPRLETFAYDKDDVVALIAGCQYPAIAVFRDTTPTVLLAAFIDGPNDSYIWDSASGVDSPLTADVVDVYVSHGSADFSAAVTALALVN